jgi:hypothetical protein
MARSYEVACRWKQDRWPGFRWERITPRPIGLNRAVALADSQPTHAVVCAWRSADKAHDNGKPIAYSTSSIRGEG